MQNQPRSNRYPLWLNTAINRYPADSNAASLPKFSSTEPASSGSICLIDADSGQIEILIREKDLGEVHPFYSIYFIELEDWSRDGSKIVFTYYTPSKKGQKQDFEIYLYDMSSKTTRKILDGKKQDVITQIGSAAISPDNKTLLISGVDASSSFQIFRVDLESNSLSQLTKSATYSFSVPVWGSDNSYFYVHVEQNTSPLKEGTAILNANGDILSFLDIKGAVIGWIK